LGTIRALVKRPFLDALRCPRCTGRSLALTVAAEDEREVREGRVDCAGCAAAFPIVRGILATLDPADESLQREVNGWHTLAGELPETLVTTMTALPNYPHVPWVHVAPDFFQIFEEVDFADRRVVDVGAGRAWSSRFLATVGRAREVVAVDVLTRRFIGLETAEIFFREDGIHFERVCGDVHRLPLADGWADAVFSCAAVHHSPDPGGLFREAARVLRPGGVLVMVSEPSKPASIMARQPDNEEVAVGINEHIYSLAEYEAALRGAGFRWRRLLPRSIVYRLRYPDPDFERALPREWWRLARRPAGRRLLLAALANQATGRMLYRHASLPLTLVATRV
jgi:SAM-dependent methyltransferase